MSQPNIVFIGGGNMASSIIGGLIANGYPKERVTATARSEQTQQRLAAEFGIQASGDNGAAASGAEVVILSVKPQMMAQVCGDLANSLSHQPLILSVAAGITTEQINRWLNQALPVVRTMPNTPSQLGAGATGLFANSHCSAAQTALAKQLISAVGTAIEIADESLMDAVTAVSGSGPAYYFLLMELMEKVGMELGLDAEAARQLTIQTAVGAGQMAAESEFDPAELRRRVTSPNGTTHQAISTFLNEGLEAIIRNGMTNARDRGRELSAELDA